LFAEKGVETGGMSRAEADVVFPANTLADVPSGRSTSLWDILTIAVVVVPILGTFNPLEVYLAGGEAAGAVASAPLSGATTGTYVLTISLLVLALYLASGRSFAIVPRFGSVLLLTYVLVAFSTVLWSPDPTFTMNRSARLVPYVGFGLVFAEYFDFNRLISLLTRAFFIAVFCSVVITIVRPDLGLSHIGGGYDSAWRGATIHKNVLGQVCSIGALVCSFSIACRCNNFLFSLLTLLLSIMTLVLSQSATSAAAVMASLTVAACFGAAAQSGLKAKIGLFAVIGVVVILAIAIATSPETIFDFAGRDATLTGRTNVWAAVGADIARSPFWGEYYGFWGIDSTASEVIWRQVTYQVPHSHNSWLDIWLQLGLPGLLTIIAICLFIIITGIRLYFKSSEPVVLFSLSLFVSLLVRSGAEVQFTDPFPSGLFWLALSYGCLSKSRKTVAHEVDNAREAHALGAGRPLRPC
jgi:O-antigen ligase